MLRNIRKTYGNKEICKVTVDQAIGGMRNVFGLFYDISLLDSKTVKNYCICRVSHSEITTFLRFRNTCKRLRVVMSHYLKPCFGCCWLVIFPLIKNSNLFKKSGREEVNWTKRQLNLLPAYQKHSIQWQCCLRVFCFYKRTQHFRRPMKVERPLNHNIGNTILKTQWIWLPKYLELLH